MLKQTFQNIALIAMQVELTRYNIRTIVIHESKVKKTGRGISLHDKCFRPRTAGGEKGDQCGHSVVTMNQNIWQEDHYLFQLQQLNIEARPIKAQ